LGTAKDVTLGPTAIMSLLVSSYAFHEPVYAILLAFLSGCIQLAMGLLHLGFLLDFISYPVIKGFTSAASITISFNQVKNILGLRWIPRQFFLQVYETLRRIGETRSAPALRLPCSVPRQLRGLRLRSFAPHLFGTSGFCQPKGTSLGLYIQRHILGTVSQVLLQLLTVQEAAQASPCPRPAPVSCTHGSGAVPQSGFRTQHRDTQGAAGPLRAHGGLCLREARGDAARLLSASQNDYRIDPNQELLALGFANVLGSFVSSYPITGSFGRWVTGGGAEPKPTGHSLGLYGDGALQSLGRKVVRAWVISLAGLDLVPLCVTFLLCFWEVQYGIVAGVLVSGILLLYSIARPPIKVSEGDVLLVQLGSSLHFPAIECLRDTVCTRALAASPPRSVILDCCHISSIDYTVVVGLAELLQELRKHGLSLVFCSLQGRGMQPADPVLQVLLSADLEGFQHFPSREEA
ncbi:Sodium-independent sulfate anion transporter, partial [Charadrius vociferus]